MIEIFPFKYSVGPSYKFINHSISNTFKNTFPGAYNYGVDEQMFANNINISLIFLLIPLAAMAITLLRYKKYQNETIKLKKTDQIYKRLEQL